MDTITTIPDLLTCNGSAQPVTVALTPNDHRLIASAPELKAQRDELLAAMQGVIDAWEDRSGMGTLYQMPRALSRARAAIARAESRS